MEPLKYNPNAGGGGSYAGSYPYDTRSADAIKEVILGYRNTNFQQYFTEAATHYGFENPNVSNITSWDQFIETIRTVSNTLQQNLLRMERNFSIPLNLETAHFLIMCQYVIENYSPNSVNANALFNSFMQAATMDFTPRYGSSEDVSLRTFNPTIPVAYAPQVHASAHEFERQIRDNALLMDIFATDSSRDRVVNALAESPMMCGLLPLTRDAMYVQSNPVEVIDSALSTATSGEPQTYLWWLTTATDEGLIELKTEMHTRIQTILSELSDPDREPLIEFISKIGATDQTLAKLNAKMKEMFSTGYFLNVFTPDQLLRQGLIDQELIAGGLLDMCLQDNIRNQQMVSEARSVFDFMNQDLIYGVVHRIKNGNPEIFTNAWLRFHPINRTIRGSSKIGPRTIEPQTHKNVTNKQVAEFLKVREDQVRLGFDRVSRSSKASSRSSKSAPTSKYEIKLNAKPSISIASADENPLSDAEDIERRSRKLEDFKSLLGETIEYSGSYLASLGQLFGPYLESVRGVGASLYGRSADLVGNLYGRSAGFAGDLYSRSAGLANRANQFVGSAFSSRDPISAGGSINSSISFANLPSATHIAPSQLRGRPKDMSRREIEGSRQNNNNTNSFEPSVVPTYVKNGGGASVQSSPYPTDADWEANINYGRRPPTQPTLSEANVGALPSNVSKNIDPEVISVNDNTRQHDALSPKRIILKHLRSLNKMFKHIIKNKIKQDKTEYFKKCVRWLNINLQNMTHPSINIEPLQIPTMEYKDSNEIDNNIKTFIIPVINENIRKLETNIMRGGKLRKTRKPRHSMSKNKKTLRRNPRKLMSRRQKYSRRK